MSIPIITQGATTDHGGIVEECFETFTIDGKKVHLDGMKHFCPKCNKEVSAIASNHTKTMMGRAWVLEGDKASCGATFIANQSMGFVGKSSKDPSQIDTSGLGNNLLENTENHEYGNKFQILDRLTQTPLSNVKYKLVYDSKEILGTTDEQGYTKFVSSSQASEVEIFVISNDEEVV
ncbi:PAAR domain-containing protein [Moraxella boevrei]|uniref:PAAR domain-containing protein n=1 Tax=Faucicola boevrei TaxID=346665 RepID=UPI003736CEC2